MDPGAHTRQARSPACLPFTRVVMTAIRTRASRPIPPAARKSLFARQASASQMPVHVKESCGPTAIFFLFRGSWPRACSSGITLILPSANSGKGSLEVAPSERTSPSWLGWTSEQPLRTASCKATARAGLMQTPPPLNGCFV